MSEIAFYRQQRRDGGIRTGLALDQDTMWEHFLDGNNDSDPSLEWFVDVRIAGRRLPRSPREVQRWFLDHAGSMQEALRALADIVSVGIDANGWPFQWSAPVSPSGTKLKIVCSFTRRYPALDAARQLLDIAAHWSEYLLLPRPHETAPY